MGAEGAGDALNGRRRRRPLTLLAEVVDQDDLVQQFGGRPLDDAVHGAHQRRPALVVEDDDDRGAGQILRVVPVFTSANGETAAASQR